jgi:hypothetical protein
MPKNGKSNNFKYLGASIHFVLLSSRCFSTGSPVSSTNKTDRRDITENIGESGVKHHNTNSNP